MGMLDAAAPASAAVNGPEDDILDWDAVVWRVVEDDVRRLRQRIFTATQAGDWKKVRNLQKLMLRSRTNALASVRRVTEINAGRKTAGVDRRLVVDDQDKAKMAAWLQHGAAAWTPRPVKRVFIPKAGGKRRGLGIPVIADRCLQALTVTALEPEWEARFESRSYGFRPGRSCQVSSTRFDGDHQAWRNIDGGTEEVPGGTAGAVDPDDVGRPSGPGVASQRVPADRSAAGDQPGDAARLGDPGRDRCRRPARHDDGRGRPARRARAGGSRAAPSKRDPAVGIGFLRGGARPPLPLIVDYIEEHRDAFGVEPICTVLSSADVTIAPSTYYAARTRPPSARAVRDEEVTAEISTVSYTHLRAHETVLD